MGCKPNNFQPMMYMKKTSPLFLLIAIFTLWLSPARAFEIAVVQTSSARPYEESYQGFIQTTAKSASTWGHKSISPDSTTRIVLSEVDPSFDLQSKLQGLHPDIIIAIGRKALLRVMNYSEAPIIHMLAPFPPAKAQNNPNISGIDLNLSPAKQLSAFLDVFPSIKRIGTIYNPSETGEMVRQAKAFAGIAGIEIVSLKAVSDKEAIQQMALLRNNVDAFWMLPDRSLLTPIFIESQLRFSFENRVPLLTFSDKYLEMGATLSLAAAHYAMGERAGHLAMQTLKPTEQENGFQEQYVETATLRLNEKIAKKIGIISNTAALKISPAQKVQ